MNKILLAEKLAVICKSLYPTRVVANPKNQNFDSPTRCVVRKGSPKDF